MSDNNSFFSDPKVWISILALAVSVGSLVWTLVTQRDQNRRWDALNAGSVELKEAKFYVWREVTRDEALTINWGYNPLLFSSADAYNKFRIVYFLQLRDPVSGAPVPHANPVFTMSEVDNEVKRLGVKPPISVFRAFRPVFILENTGKTEVTDCHIEIDMRAGEEEWRRAFTANTPIRIAPGQPVNVSYDFALPFNTEIPKQISFRLHATFTDLHGRKRKRDVTASWESERDYWFYGAGGKS